MGDACIEALFVGEPRGITDARGTWTSSIGRERVHGPVGVFFAGFAGDRVTQPYHGGRGAAVCVHLAEHYLFWNARLQMNMSAGAVGENVTLSGIAEGRICVGDEVRLGTALVEVSGPRVPCANLARRIGRADWVKQTIRENRTGLYLRVLEEGLVQQGDAWLLQVRKNHSGSIPAINRCMFLDFDPEYARSMLEMVALEAWWKEQAQQKLEQREKHWTSAMREDPAEE